MFHIEYAKNIVAPINLAEEAQRRRSHCALEVPIPSRNRNAAEVALDGSFVKGIYGCGRSERCGFVRLRPGQTADFIRGMKSPRGNGWQNLAGFQRKEISVYPY